MFPFIEGCKPHPQKQPQGNRGSWEEDQCLSQSHTDLEWWFPKWGGVSPYPLGTIRNVLSQALPRFMESHALGIDSSSRLMKRPRQCGLAPMAATTLVAVYINMRQTRLTPQTHLEPSQ